MVSGATMTKLAPEGVKKTTFRPDIQGLRMVAVVAVIFDHLLGWPSGGFVGVDVFFVISGFLITGLLIREHERTGTISFTGFYRRRIKRIIPVATVVVVLTVVAAWFLFNRPRFWSTFWDGFYATFFTANWRYAAVGTDYFQAEAAVSPLQHYWSLSVEEQFYFVWPWVMLAIFALTGRRWSAAVGRRTAGIVMLVLVAASLAWSLYETQSNPTVAYFSTLSRTWELGIGALIAVFAGAFSRIPDKARPVLGWIGLAGILVSLFVVSADSAFPAPWAALPVAATALVIIAGTGGEQHHMWPLTNPVARYIGDISYSLYIWHWPIIVFGTVLWGDNPLVLFALLVAIALVSIYSYHFFEDPIRRSQWLEPRQGSKKKRHRSNRRSGEGMTRKAQAGMLILAVAVTTGVSAAALAHVAPSESVAQMAPNTDGALAGATEAPSTTPELASLRSSIITALRASSYPENMSPTMDEAIGGPQAPADVAACGQTGQLVDHDACTWGAADAANRAVIVGDSVSMTWVNPMRNALPEDWSLTTLGTFGCAFTNYPEGSSGADCAGRRADAVQYINDTAPQVVIIANSYWLGALDGATEAPTPDELETDYTALLSRFDTSRTRVVFLAAPPSTQNPNSCYTPLSTPADCVSSVADRWEGQASAEKAVAAAVDGRWIDSTPLFCANDRCPAFVDTVPVRRDLTHMTPAYGEKIIPALREVVKGVDLLGGAPPAA